ncbi:MAG: VWA domain-containing protein [Terracidiphilus sp.]|nr:VWA domain-containing protein [Terracidiphilus sp.]
MKALHCYFGLLFALVSSAPGCPVIAQQLPPIEPPRQMPAPGDTPTTIRVTSREVLVPTLIEDKDGSVVYGLRPSDFILEDNGVPQKIRVQEEMDTAPVALVVAVEQGGASSLEFDKVSRLGPMLDMFLSDPQSEAAIMGFDSRPHLLHDFAHTSDELNDTLRHLDSGDGGAAILDTISSAADLLETQPKEYRRVLLLVSEERDHGSKHTKSVDLIKKIGGSDVLVLSVSFSPMRAELIHDVKDNGDNRYIHGENLISTVLMLVQAFKKNVAKEISQESGGEYLTFTRDKTFEARVLEAAKHVRNRYLLTFSPSDPAPGLHTIRVHTTQDIGARIVARANYWLEGPQ